MGLTASLIVFFILIAATAFFVATEFAVVKLRPSRANQLVAEGRRNAAAVQKVVNNLDGYLSACQLGITITALGLGWLGEPTVEKILEPIFARLHVPHAVSSLLAFAIAFVIVTFLHVVVGELAPKTFAIRKTEQICLLFCPAIIVFNKIMYPFIWLLNGSANGIVRLFGVKPATESEEAHSEEELRIIMSESYESGKINQEEFGYVDRIFNFDNLLAHEIMIPRMDMVCLYTSRSLQENLAVIKEEKYTRFPVVSDNKDHVIGMINTKQFFLEYDDNPELDFRTIIHPILTVPETIPVKDLLARMRRERVHLAHLVDEFGGTSGIVTLEDIIEEIIGEIRDEFDEEEQADVERIGPGQFIVDGKLSLTHINRLLEVELAGEEAGTISGWLFERFPDIQEGEPHVFGELLFTVLDMEQHRINRVEIRDNKAVLLTDQHPGQETNGEADGATHGVSRSSGIPETED